MPISTCNIAKKQPTIVTKRLVLRPFGDADIDRLAKLSNDKRIAEMTLLIPHPYTEETAQGWIATHRGEFERGEGVIFAVTMKGEDGIIGAIGLGVDSDHNRGDMGYWLGVPYWNRGFCSEAAGAVVAYGFEELKLNKICANHFTTNPASGRVMVKIGMTEEGLFRKHVEKWGEYKDIICYGILAEEYMKKLRESD